MFTEVQVLIARIRVELERLRHDEGGYSTETVVVTALLIALAIAALALLAAAVLKKAGGITL
ncbi:MULTISPECIES: hypothetical protein [Amycolatopsis]|uniref:Uncharacterized protein n=1 Tax=Amycolatopsis albidoflavus TaxID=102226 RepID=A0ABW5IGP8_9PSEU